MNHGTENDAINLAHQKHSGQVYGDFSYIKHLRDVSLQLGSRGYHSDLWKVVAYLHDLIEDTDVTYEEIEVQFGTEAAMMVAAVTTPSALGNRKARLKVLIENLTGYPAALPLKLADRIANVQHCWFSRNSKLFMYHREYPRFRGGLRPLSVDREEAKELEMWDKLDEMMGWWEPAKGGEAP